MDDKPGLIAKLQAANQCPIPNMDIRWIGWLESNLPAKQNASTLVIELGNPEQANAAVAKINEDRRIADLKLNMSHFWPVPRSETNFPLFPAASAASNAQDTEPAEQDKAQQASIPIGLHPNKEQSHFRKRSQKGTTPNTVPNLKVHQREYHRKQYATLIKNHHTIRKGIRTIIQGRRRSCRNTINLED
ncbi:MAG: hypothetical protein Q9226_001622 [Calogaya cf. arnoldii]